MIWINYIRSGLFSLPPGSGLEVVLLMGCGMAFLGAGMGVFRMITWLPSLVMWVMDSSRGPFLVWLLLGN